MIVLILPPLNLYMFFVHVSNLFQLFSLLKPIEMQESVGLALRLRAFATTMKARQSQIAATETQLKREVEGMGGIPAKSLRFGSSVVSGIKIPCSQIPQEMFSKLTECKYQTCN